MANLLQILSELNKFDKSLYQLFEGANLDSIVDLEKKLNYELPRDYKEFLMHSDGADILCEYLYSINRHRHLIDIYSNYLSEKNEVSNPIPSYLLPISPNGRGDHDCLDLNTLTDNKGTCSVVFWQHDYSYDNEDKPRLITSSFYDYLLEIMNNYLEDNNYDGSEKNIN